MKPEDHTGGTAGGRGHLYPLGRSSRTDDQGDAPEHGVARISLVNGDVSVRRGDSGELTAAALNGPLVVNDHLVTGQNARAEIQFDWGNMIRLGPETRSSHGRARRPALSGPDRRRHHHVPRAARQRRGCRNQHADGFRPARGAGKLSRHRFPDGATEITVRAGRAEIFSPRGSENLTAGRTMEARGDARRSRVHDQRGHSAGRMGPLECPTATAPWRTPRAIDT